MRKSRASPLAPTTPAMPQHLEFCLSFAAAVAANAPAARRPKRESEGSLWNDCCWVDVAASEVEKSAWR